MSDLISRQAAIDRAVSIPMFGRDVKMVAVGEIKNLPSAQPEITLESAIKYLHSIGWMQEHDRILTVDLPFAQPNLGKYEYHYDHTDCIWYRPEARNRCPVTCAQYRDGWNDAMNYIFRDGKGYMPYRRDKQYGE